MVMGSAYSIFENCFYVRSSSDSGAAMVKLVLPIYEITHVDKIDKAANEIRDGVHITMKVLNSNSEHLFFSSEDFRRVELWNR